MRVTEATYDDHAELLVLTKNAELKHVRDYSNKFMINEDAYQKGRIWVVRRKGAIVGFVAMNHRVTRKDYTNIMFIGVHPVYRGQGIAKALIQKALKLSPWGRLHAHVAENNPQAIEWYRRTGWKKIGGGNWKKGPYVTMEKTA